MNTACSPFGEGSPVLCKQNGQILSGVSPTWEKEHRVSTPSQMSRCPSRALSPPADLLRTESLCLALALPQEACLLAVSWHRLPPAPRPSPTPRSYVSVYWIQRLALSLSWRHCEVAESIGT